MPQNSGLSRYNHLKAIFSRNPSQQAEGKEDTTSESPLVPRQTQTKSYKKRHIPQNYNAADMCFGSCCRN
ncbi:hypothetical protein E8E15_002202 [Penicillium rubens]|uniref:Uncharacterized protein n=1 Tax=Penicillium chrysogenum TaxID=5076 RepID=A0A167VBQ6_PENCH|nr:hypothetical protein E8E15_002202 [Penicillium rubens]KAJ5045250.1 hypothetical protein NUH16_002062 [Penicillium rubens]KZN90260.1 hypothetical protein EN45_003770 [Penicillium chrysogenum]